MRLKAHSAAAGFRLVESPTRIDPKKLRARHERGTTLVEVAVAGALLALGLTSLYALFGTSVKEAKTGDTAALGAQNTLARIDQIRNLTWNNTTSPSYIATLLNNSTPPSLNSSTISQEVVSVYPAAVPPTLPAPVPAPAATAAPGSTPFFSVTKTGAAAATTIPSAPVSIVGERLLRVEVTTTISGNAYPRQLSTYISKAGTKTR